MIRNLLLAAAALVVAVLVAAALRPDRFAVQRSARIDAPAERIYPLIADLRAMSAWSPFERKDAKLRRTYSGPPIGPGAALAFAGNREVGAGRIEVRSVEAPRRVVMQLDMSEPLEGHNTVEFTLVPDAGATRVTWAMAGEQSYLGKLVGMVLDMDGMLGGEFERGLANLKTLAEQRSSAPPAAPA